jgi:type I restriction enzyme, S subunit
MMIAFDNYRELGSLAEFRNGINFNKDNFGKGIKVIGVSDFQSRTTPVYKELAEINPHGVVLDDDYLKENDIVFVRSNGSPGLVGRCLLIRNLTEKVTFSGFTIRLRFIAPDIDSLFYTYLFQSPFFRKLLSLQGSGTNIRNLSQSLLKNIQVPILPLPEQRKIAEILSTWDEAIDLTAQLMAAKQRRKQALMQRLLMGKVRFPGFEDEWEMVTIDDVTSKVGSGITPKGGSESYLASGIPLIRSQNVLTGVLNLEDVAFISEEQHNKMSATQLKAKDVLLNITGASIGRSCVVPVDFVEGNVNQHVCIIRPTEQLNSTFLSAFLNSAIGQRQIDAFQAGGNRQGLNYTQIRSFKIPLPTIEEQEKTAQILQICDEELDLLQQKLTALRRQKQGLMQQLLTGKVRVQV